MQTSRPALLEESIPTAFLAISGLIRGDRPASEYFALGAEQLKQRTRKPAPSSGNS